MDNIKLSVIVPIYNVEEYLHECLDSLANQTLKDIEVIMIDDGSTDYSANIAKEYEDKYDNFYYHYKENGGLGNARNYGIPYVRGKFLSFLDSDDIIPSGAYEKMYNVAVENDVDIVCGNMKRFNSKKVYDSYLHKKVYKRNINKTHISAFKNLIYDTTSTNKIYKVDFYKKNNFMFPEGIYYEDIPMVIPALWKADSVSIVTDTCYLWRTREGENKSITQKRTAIKNFTDRIKVMDMVDLFYQENVRDKECIALKDYKWLDTDLKLFINQMTETTPQYNEIAFKEINRFLNKIDSQILNHLRTIDKIKYNFIKNNDIEGLKQTIKFQKNKKNFKVRKKNNKYYATFPFNVTPELADVTDELRIYPLNHKLLGIKNENNYLNISLFIRVPKIMNQYDFKTNAYFVSERANVNEKIPIQRSLIKINDYYEYSKSKKRIVKSILLGCFYLIKLDLSNNNISTALDYGGRIKIVLKNDILFKKFFLEYSNSKVNLKKIKLINYDGYAFFLKNEADLCEVKDGN